MYGGGGAFWVEAELAALPLPAGAGVPQLGQKLT